MTYGWAILVVLVSIAALAYFGVLKQDRFVPEKCVFEPGLACLGFKLESSSATVVLRNSLGDDITIDKVEVSTKEGISCSKLESKVIKNNEKATLILSGCNNGDVGSRFDGEIIITYTKKDLLTHTTKGRMTARIEAGTTEPTPSENITCSNNLDCGTDEFIGNYYCSNGDVYRNQTAYSCLNPGTEDSSCTSATTPQVIDTCEVGEECVEGQSNCQTLNITCSADSDCGVSGFIGDYYCSNNYVSRNQLNYTCTNPGTANSQCVVSNTSIALTYCDPNLNDVCVDGQSDCQVNVTCIDSDGGINIYVKGTTTRNDGTNWTDTCPNPSQVSEGYCDDTSSTGVRTTVKSCLNGCIDGACVDEPTGGPTGLIAHWTFDEGSGSIASDSSGNNNHRTIYGATWVDGIKGKALSFNGAECSGSYDVCAYVELGSGTPLSISGDMTILMWIKIKQGAGEQHLMTDWTHFGSNYALFISRDRLRAGSGDGWTGSTSPLGNTYLSRDVWYFVSYVRSGNNLYLYIDDYEDMSVAIPDYLTGGVTTNNIRLGARTDRSPSMYFDGIMDEVRVWNRSLSATEIQEIYNQEKK